MCDTPPPRDFFLISRTSGRAAGAIAYLALLILALCHPGTPAFRALSAGQDALDDFGLFFVCDVLRQFLVSRYFCCVAFFRVMLSRNVMLRALRRARS